MRALMFAVLALVCMNAEAWAQQMVGPEFRINTDTSSDKTEPRVATLGDGSFVVTWTSDLQDGFGLGVYGQRYSVAGARLGTEFQINGMSAKDQSSSSIAALTTASLWWSGLPPVKTARGWASMANATRPRVRRSAASFGSITT
jgi:hypothetical protein